MITKEQALTCEIFHYGTCIKHRGPRGGMTIKSTHVRRNGATQIWKRDPERFRVPVKYGMYTYSEITNSNAEMFHTEEDCPLNED